MKKMFSIVSLALGVCGLSLFFKPALELSCGIGGLIFAVLARDKNAGMILDSIRHCGLCLAWINIIWFCVEALLGISIL